MSANDVRLWELWDAVVARLGTARMQALLRGAGRVYRGDQDYSREEGPLEQPWGRVVVVPTRQLWDMPDDPGAPRKVGFLLRAECNAPPNEPAFNAGRLLEAVQAEAYGLLRGWAPPPARYVRVVLPIHRWTAPQPLPLWDEERRLYYLSSEYRCETAKPLAGVAP